jgi:hypothetical protein
MADLDGRSPGSVGSGSLIETKLPARGLPPDVSPYAQPSAKSSAVPIPCSKATDKDCYDPRLRSASSLSLSGASVRAAEHPVAEPEAVGTARKIEHFALDHSPEFVHPAIVAMYRLTKEQIKAWHEQHPSATPPASEPSPLISPSPIGLPPPKPKVLPDTKVPSPLSSPAKVQLLSSAPLGARCAPDRWEKTIKPEFKKALPQTPFDKALAAKLETTVCINGTDAATIESVLKENKTRLVLVDLDAAGIEYEDCEDIGSCLYVDIRARLRVEERAIYKEGNKPLDPPLTLVFLYQDDLRPLLVDGYAIEEE